jgi:methylglutamate dehydrogenase subunit D
MQVIARHGAATATAAAIKSVLGVELPNSPRVENGAGLAVIWSGPDQWIVMADLERGAEIEYKVREAVSGLASCVDQSHSRVQIGVSGAHASDVLSKLVTVDLDPSVFAEDMVAMTVIAHIPVYVWRSRNADGTPAFEIAGPQSYAESLWHHVVVAAAEYGVEQRFTTPSITQARS